MRRYITVKTYDLCLLSIQERWNGMPVNASTLRCCSARYVLMPVVCNAHQYVCGVYVVDVLVYKYRTHRTEATVEHLSSKQN